MSNIAIFASGSGTNAENIMQFFRTHPSIHVKMVLTNNPEAGVIMRAEKHGVDCVTFDRSFFREPGAMLGKLKEYKIDFIVLAGFLWLIPGELVQHFPNAIVNIHPALLPKYGGKGMYGSRVHQAVIENGETESGITIHYVNEHYDEGNIIFQAKCSVEIGDTPSTLAEKVHRLEYEHFPRVLETLIEN